MSLSRMTARERLDPAIPADPHLWWEETAHLWRYYYAAVHAKGRVADAACGTGYGTDILLNAGHRTVGFDKDATGMCRRLDLDVHPTLDGFDTLVSFETLEHLKDPWAFLKGLAPSLTTLLCSAPIVPTTHYNPYHLHDFTLASFQDMIEAAGFQIEETHRQSSPWRENVYAVVLARR